MNVTDFERLISSSKAISQFTTEHLAMLIMDEGHGTEEAMPLLDRVFTNSDADDAGEWRLADVLAIRLVRQAALDVCDRLEVYAAEHSP